LYHKATKYHFVRIFISTQIGRESMCWLCTMCWLAVHVASFTFAVLRKGGFAGYRLQVADRSSPLSFDDLVSIERVRFLFAHRANRGEPCIVVRW